MSSKHEQVFDYTGLVVAFQGSLLDGLDAPGPRELVPGLDRLTLEGGAWVEVRRDWVGGADALFERLIHRVPWRSERRPMYDRVVDVPRLMAFYGEKDRLPDPMLEPIRAALLDHYRDDFDGQATAGLCLYRDGDDSVAFHGDTIGRGARHDTVVAIVSLGCRRRLLLRPRSGGRALRFELAGGDLLVMGGSCQRTWEHAVPKTARPSGPRISVQFRPRGVR